MLVFLLPCIILNGLWDHLEGVECLILGLSCHSPEVGVGIRCLSLYLVGVTKGVWVSLSRCFGVCEYQIGCLPWGSGIDWWGFNPGSES